MQRLQIYAIAFVIALLVFPSTASSQTQEPPPESRPEQSPTPSTPPTKFVKHKKVVPNHYIVVLNDDVVSDDEPLEVRRARITEIANNHAQAHHGKVYYIYETALKGYSIVLPDEAAAIAISKLPEVKLVEEDAIGEVGIAMPQPWRPGTSKSLSDLALRLSRTELYFTRSSVLL